MTIISLAMIAVCAVVPLSNMYAQTKDAPSGLLCNLLTEPEKCIITEPRPDFGWVVNSTMQDDIQTSYRIIVASSRQLLEKQKPDMWDSGKVVSSQSINVIYNGKPLSPDSSYWWAVSTWNRHGDKSPFSPPQRFNTGTFDRKGKKWPSESRWVELADEAGKKNWTFENRPPINFHSFSASRVVPVPDGRWFIDFGKAAFAAFQVEIEWIPAKSGPVEHTIQVAVGEKNKGTSVNPKPGGGIIYKKLDMKIRPGKHTYILDIPRFEAHYPHSQTMPKVIPEVIPFRYCELMPAGETILVSNPIQNRLWVDFDDEAAAFSSSNTDLNKVYELCKYSVKVNTFNGDYAASQRERMMYEADSYIHQMSHYATDRAFATARYSTENQVFHASWPTEWISHSIFMVWADYLHTGNKRSIERYYDQIKPKTLLALAGDDGLISTRTGKVTKKFLETIHLNNKNFRDIVDWPAGERDNYDFKTYNTVVNTFHYRSLVLMGKIAKAIGKDADAKFYSKRAAWVLAAVNRSMFDKKRGVYVDGIDSEHVSLHANLFPLAFGMVPESHLKSVAEYVKSRGMACSVYPTVYLLEALYDAGEDQAALDLMTATHDRSWLHMLEVGSTVTTEAWDIKYKRNSGWTHAWSSAPAQILPRKLMGIEPLEPGFVKIRIQPRPGNLKHATTRLPTIRGTIQAEFKRSAESFELTVTIPVNVTAEVILPVYGENLNKIMINGKQVKVGENVLMIRKENNKIAYNVGSGKYKFVSKNLKRNQNE